MTTNTEIGRRIESSRKSKGWTQQDLAGRLGLSRSSVTQIEQGKRKVSALELYQLSVELGTDLSEFFGENNAVAEPAIEYAEEVEKTVRERISTPPDPLNYSRFKHILLYLLEQCAGKPNVGETVLYKLLYFSDFNHYEVHEQFLTGSRYRKLPYGPVPEHLDTVLNKLIQDGDLERVNTTYFDYPQTRYLPLKKADLSKIDGSEKETLDRVVEQFSDWSASSMSEYSHRDIPWKATPEGEIIDYELAFYREPPFSARHYDYDEREDSDI